MAERIREIQFQFFRGLPDYKCLLKGKNFAILGGNGKGKSAIVDGLEFLFSGGISRFHGEGTGAIDAGEGVRHVQNKGDPVVELHFVPTNASVRRRLSQGTIELPAQASIRSYMASHPPVGAFILRRSQILEFISDRDASRYQKYIQLLGLSDIDAMQRAFVEAEERAERGNEQARRAMELQLAAFRDQSSGAPTSLAYVLARCSEAVKRLRIGTADNWSDLEPTIALLESKRTPATKLEVDALNRCIASLQRPMPDGMKALAETATTLHAELRVLRSASDEAPQKGVIREALDFFEAHPGITACPLCEQELSQGFATTFDRLKQRSVTLAQIQGVEAKRSKILEQLTVDAQRCVDHLASDLEHGALFSSDNLRILRDARAVTIEWLKSLKRTVEEERLDPIGLPSRLEVVFSLRAKLVSDCETRRRALIPSDAALLENTIALLKKAKGAEPAIRSMEAAVKRSANMVTQAGQAKLTFSSAREQAIQKAFDRIASLVLHYYQKLHEYGANGSSSECSELAMKQTSRAAAGGLRLAIRFLGLTAFKDPRPFLSEGHLDSLGLCIYLATVRTFNPPGSLLVMDDVLTSIDQGHRYRVAELLFEQFGDYQIVLTTHDEHWFDILQSSARARGEHDKWRFSRIARWTVDRGPESAAFEGTWSYIEENLKEESYRELGGPLRVVFEDFLKRVAAKVDLQVKYNFDDRYTSGDFVFAGIEGVIRDRLIAATPVEEAAIRQEVGRVFGMGDLINFLSHDNPGRLDVTFEQTSDFVAGLTGLISRCKTGRLMKGVSP